MAGFALRGPCKLCRMQATSALPQRTYTTLARSFPTLLAIYRAPLLGSRSCTLTRLALLLLCKAFSLFRYWQYLILACLCQVLFSAFRKIFFASFFLPPFPIVTGSISYLLACVKCFFATARNFFLPPFLSLSLKPVSHTCLLVSSVFLALPKTFFLGRVKASGVV